MAILIPDRTRTVLVGANALTINEKIVPDTARATKNVASYVQKGQPMKPCALLAGTGKPMGITIHNTEPITVAANTTPAEQYTRATWPNCNMGGVIPHFYVWRSVIWQLLAETERGWHATDGTSRRASQRTGQKIGGNLDTIAIECIGADAETERTAALLVAYLLQEHSLSPDTDIYTHNYFYSAKYCPAYILPHWSSFMASVKSFYNTGNANTTSSQDGAPTEDGIVYFLGGKVYSSSAATTAARERGSSSCRLTKTVTGAPHPYHLISVDDGEVYGWVDAAKVSEGQKSAGGVQVGSPVRITGTHYATGGKIPGWVKEVTHPVTQFNGDGDQVLLDWPKGISSWVYLKDIKLG